VLVCLCHAVSDKDLDHHVATGCRSVSELARRCGAGADCGSCVRDLARGLRQRRRGANDASYSAMDPALAAR
jgi:bacterioferritin-associated ferredoxin